MSIDQLITGALATVLRGFEGLQGDVVAVWHELEASEPTLAARAAPFVSQVTTLYRERGMSPAAAAAFAQDTWEKLAQQGEAPANPDHLGGG